MGKGLNRSTEREGAALATECFCSIHKREALASGKLSWTSQEQLPALLRFREENAQPWCCHSEKEWKEEINNLLRQAWIMEVYFETDVNPIRWRAGESLEWVEVILHNNGIIRFLLLHGYTRANLGTVQPPVSQMLCTNLKGLKLQNIYSCISHLSVTRHWALVVYRYFGFR